MAPVVSALVPHIWQKAPINLYLSGVKVAFSGLYVWVQTQFKTWLTTGRSGQRISVLRVFIVRSVEPHWRLLSGNNKQCSLFESEAEFLQTDRQTDCCSVLVPSSVQTESFVSDGRLTHKGERGMSRDLKFVLWLWAQRDVRIQSWKR